MLLLLVSYLLCGTIRGRLPGEKVERNFATSNNNLIWNVLFKLQYPYSLTVEDITNKCPVFGKDECPYKDLIVELNGITENCPAFKDGCPFKDLKTMGEYVERMAQMRDTINPKGRAAFLKFNQRVLEISKEAEKIHKPWPFPANSCPFAHDAWGKPIVPKYDEGANEWRQDAWISCISV